MTKAPISEAEIIQTDDYLKSYAMYARILRIENNKRTATVDACENLCIDVPIARAKTFEIRHFIMDLPNSNEKLLLYYHFIKNETISRCAELLGISRSSAFRLKRRALILASDRLRKINLLGGNKYTEKRSA